MGRLKGWASPQAVNLRKLKVTCGIVGFRRPSRGEDFRSPLSSLFPLESVSVVMRGGEVVQYCRALYASPQNFQEMMEVGMVAGGGWRNSGIFYQRRMMMRYSV